MQKKSLLVALFCGALCLTGCLKNEESASVAQVRIAKANELNSIADLNKAKAQAEVIYANAEATLKNAQAELEKANAALVLAEAETEKVRAQLLGVQVKLAEVLVEEEKVKLQMMQADLESRLAFLEAEKAAAEAAKQAWVNVLNDLLAQAEISTIENAKSLLEAEQQLEDYILKQAGQKADSAKYYAGMYFAALEDVEEAQMQVLQAKAQRVLVNQGAILAREYIHEEIDAANDTIAMNQAFIDALKEKQTMSPEEAQAALQEARLAAGEAYAAYIEALKAENEARTAANEAFDKEADFTQDWWPNFAYDVRHALPRWARATQDVEVTVGEGETERIVEVPTFGVRVWSEENGVEFVPLWNEEVIDTTVIRYPAADVVAPGHKTLNDIRIVPATINYDNIKEALDAAIEREEAEAERNIARRERRMNRQIAALEEDIAIWEDTLALHQAYVDARQADVEKAEKAYKDAVAAAEGNNEAVNEAWEAFQLYMLTQHPTVSRSLFINRYLADTAYQGSHARAVIDSMEYDAAITAVGDTLKLHAAVKEAFEAYAKARGVWERYKDSLEKEGTEINKAQAAYNKIVAEEWNPDFANTYNETDVDIDGFTADGYAHFSMPASATGASQTYNAGAYQDSTLSAKAQIKKAKAALYEAQINEWAGIQPDGPETLTVEQAKENLTKWEKALKHHQDMEDEAWLRYTHAYAALEDAVGVFPDDIKDVYNPNFTDIFNVVSFPTESRPNAGYAYDNYYLNAKGKWVYGSEEAGSAQADLFDAVKDVLDARIALATAKETLYNNTSDFRAAMEALAYADAALITALGGDPSKDKIEDYLDDDADALYADYLEALDEISIMDVLKARYELMLAYGMYPDRIGALKLGFNPEEGLGRVNPKDMVPFGNRNFGWLVSSYMVDPEATYVNRNGEDKSIAELFYGRVSRTNNPYENSLQWMIDDANNTIEVELPEALAEYTAEQNAEVEEFKADVADIIAAVNAYKGLETGYQNWVEEREAAYDNYNEAKIARWAAQDVQEAAEIEYESIDAVANEGIYVYDPNHDLDEFVNDSEAASHSRGNNAYVKITIAKQIELLEEDNERLEAKVEFLRNVLKDGKKVLSVVNEIIDQKIEALSEEVAIKTALALQYKEIMNAYLGITDEDVAGETGPLDGEGDDEE